MDSKENSNDTRKIFETDMTQIKAKEEMKRIDEINARVEAEAKVTGGYGENMAKDGLTLIEMLVIVAIIFLLAMIGLKQLGIL